MFTLHMIRQRGPILNHDIFFGKWCHVKLVYDTLNILEIFLLELTAPTDKVDANWRIYNSLNKLTNFLWEWTAPTDEVGAIDVSNC